MLKFGDDCQEGLSSLGSRTRSRQELQKKRSSKKPASTCTQQCVRRQSRGQISPINTALPKRAVAKTDFTERKRVARDHKNRLPQKLLPSNRFPILRGSKLPPEASAGAIGERKPANPRKRRPRKTIGAAKGGEKWQGTAGQG